MKTIAFLFAAVVAIPIAACGARQPTSTRDDVGDGGRKVDDHALLPVSTDEAPPVAPRLPPVAKTSEEPKTNPAPSTKGSN